MSLLYLVCICFLVMACAYLCDNTSTDSILVVQGKADDSPVSGPLLANLHLLYHL